MRGQCGTSQRALWNPVLKMAREGHPPRVWPKSTCSCTLPALTHCSRFISTRVAWRTCSPWRPSLRVRRLGWVCERAWDGGGGVLGPWGGGLEVAPRPGAKAGLRPRPGGCSWGDIPCGLLAWASLEASVWKGTCRGRLGVTTHPLTALVPSQDPGAEPSEEPVSVQVPQQLQSLRKVHLQPQGPLHRLLWHLGWHLGRPL